MELGRAASSDTGRAHIEFASASALHTDYRVLPTPAFTPPPLRYSTLFQMHFYVTPNATGCDLPTVKLRHHAAKIRSVCFKPQDVRRGSRRSLKTPSRDVIRSVPQLVGGPNKPSVALISRGSVFSRTRATPILKPDVIPPPFPILFNALQLTRHHADCFIDSETLASKVPRNDRFLRKTREARCQRCYPERNNQPHLQIDVLE